MAQAPVHAGSTWSKRTNGSTKPSAAAKAAAERVRTWVKVIAWLASSKR